MNKQSLSNMDKVAFLLVFLGTIMLIGGSFTERSETIIAGLIMVVVGSLQMMNSRISRLEKKIRHDH